MKNVSFIMQHVAVTMLNLSHGACHNFNSSEIIHLFHTKNRGKFRLCHAQHRNQLFSSVFENVDKISNEFGRVHTILMLRRTIVEDLSFWIRS